MSEIMAVCIVAGLFEPVVRPGSGGGTNSLVPAWFRVRT